MLLSQIKKGFSSFFTQGRMLVILIPLLLVILLWIYANNKNYNMDPMLSMSGVSDGKPVNSSLNSRSIARNAATLENSNKTITNTSSSVTTKAPTASSATAGGNDLLPSNNNNQLSNLNPALSQNGVMAPDLLQAGSLIGLDTIGQSLRNPNYQIRSDPVIPQSNTGPWNQSTIQPEQRPPMDINACP